MSGLALVASFALHGHGCSHAAGAVGLLDPAWIPLLICGFPVAKEAFDALVGERRIRAALLISVAMVACVAIGQLFAAGEVAFIMALGEKLENWTVRRAKKGLHKLVALVPQPKARRRRCSASPTGGRHRGDGYRPGVCRCRARHGQH